MTHAALSPGEAITLTMIEAAANAGAICPSNDVIAARTGTSSPSSASAFVAGLARKGVIRVERFQAGRRAHIVATGRSTLWPHSTARHWRDRSDAVASRPISIFRAERRSPSQPRTNFTILDRAPCFRCGVRADLGCAHRAPAEPEEVVL